MIDITMFNKVTVTHTSGNWADEPNYIHSPIVFSVLGEDGVSVGEAHCYYDDNENLVTSFHGFDCDYDSMMNAGIDEVLYILLDQPRDVSESLFLDDEDSLTVVVSVDHESETYKLLTTEGRVIEGI